MENAETNNWRQKIVQIKKQNRENGRRPISRG